MNKQEEETNEEPSQESELDDKERWIQWQMKEYGYDRVSAEMNYYRWTQ